MLNRAFRRKNKAVDLPPQAPPRALEDIQKEYGVVSGQFAAAEYQAKVYADEGQRLYQKLRELNNEAGERQKLDANTPKEEPKNA